MVHFTNSSNLSASHVNLCPRQLTHCLLGTWLFTKPHNAFVPGSTQDPGQSNFYRAKPTHLEVSCRPSLSFMCFFFFFYFQHQALPGSPCMCASLTLSILSVTSFPTLQALPIDKSSDGHLSQGRASSVLPFVWIHCAPSLHTVSTWL